MTSLNSVICILCIVCIPFGGHSVDNVCSPAAAIYREYSGCLALFIIYRQQGTPESWSIFGQSVRTNNNEGWHYHLNHICARENVNIYVLIEVLHKECTFIFTQCQLLADEKLRHYQRKPYIKHQQKILELWDQLHQTGRMCLNTYLL